MKLLRLHSCHNDLSPVAQVPVLAVFPSVHCDGVGVGVGRGDQQGLILPQLCPSTALRFHPPLSSFVGLEPAEQLGSQRPWIMSPPAPKHPYPHRRQKLYHFAVKPNLIGPCLWEHWLSGDPCGNVFFRSAEPSAVLLWTCPDSRTALGMPGPL